MLLLLCWCDCCCCCCFRSNFASRFTESELVLVGESTEEEEVGEDSPEARGANAPLIRALTRRLGESRRLSTCKERIF